MPTKPAAPDLLTGFNALLAGAPLADTPRGGMETSDKGISTGDPALQQPGLDPAPQSPFAGAGPLLEQDDKTVFEITHGLVLRQEQLAMNRLACDTHWAFLASGYPWSTLVKDPGRDTYRQALPYGVSGVATQAVPNKALDLLNKTTEMLLVDFPEADAEPMDDSDEAEHAADLANRFLAADAGDQGTNDPILFFERLQRALYTSSTFIECWVDPAGGGYVPLQIKAHPFATDPLNPFVDGEGNPTTDYVLRYVTGQVQPDGSLAPGATFTDDPSQATPQWRPKLRAARWNREHIRVYPENARVEDAEKVIILGFCTLSEARRRWDSVRQMNDEELSHLTDWNPNRFLPLLPPFMRGRWRLTDGLQKQRQGSSDERIMFYYHVYIKPCPDYPKGADVVVTGIDGGFVIDKRLLARPVDITRGAKKMTELRCMEIPVVQITPVQDVFDSDPQGRAFIELFAGAVENTSHLAMSFADLVNQIVHTPWVVPGTSPVDGQDVRNARATGDMILINKPEDMPRPLQSPPVPNMFFEMFELSDDAINSMASANRPAQGSDRQQEVSGRAREIAVQQNNVGNTSKQNILSAVYSRWGRIKLERAMAEFSVPQQIAYEGEDGAFKQAEWTGVDLALVGKVATKSGTATMMTPDQKVQYLGNLQAAGLLPAAEAAEAARPSFSKRLGIAADPHEQYIERCIAAWLDGVKVPPSPQWVQQYQAWKADQQRFQQEMAAFQQGMQLFQQAQQAQAIIAGGAPPVKLGPEAQNESAMDHYQMAIVTLRQIMQQTGGAMPVMPQQPQPPTVPQPYTPFVARPNQTEPAIAAIWARKLSKVISSVKYDQAIPEWRELLDAQYNLTRQAVATATGAAPASPPQSRPVGTPEPQQPVQSPSFPGPRSSNTQPQSVQQKPQTSAKAA